MVYQLNLNGGTNRRSKYATEGFLGFYPNRPLNPAIPMKDGG